MCFSASKNEKATCAKIAQVEKIASIFEQIGANKTCENTICAKIAHMVM